MEESAVVRDIDKNLIKELKEAILSLVKEKYDMQSKNIEKDVEIFLKDSKDRLLRWTQLLANKQLTKEEYALLLTAQKDQFVIETLYQAGISKISLGHLKNSIVDIIINTALRFLIGK